MTVADEDIWVKTKGDLANERMRLSLEYEMAHGTDIRATKVDANGGGKP